MQLELEEFEEINQQELNEILAITGMDREADFNLEDTIELIWSNEEKYTRTYPQLVYKRR